MKLNMDQEKISKLIRQIRKDNNLTQQQFANKYNVTYQAVSKWENSKNIPDMQTLKQISKDFNISLDDILNGDYKKKKKKKLKYIFVLLSIILIIIILLLINKSNNFEFKTISSSCDNFTISGSLSYNSNKSAIYITNINYCGGKDNNKYNDIDCTLYEIYNDKQVKISTYSYKNSEFITLKKFLREVTLSVDNYTRICKEYSDNSLMLVIKANNGNITTTYDIPLSIEKKCN